MAATHNPDSSDFQVSGEPFWTPIRDIVAHDPLVYQNPEAKTLAHPDVDSIDEPVRTFSDGSYRYDDGVGSTGYIVLDRHGVVCAIGARELPDASSSDYCELQALVCALRCADRLDAAGVFSSIDPEHLYHGLSPEYERTLNAHHDIADRVHQLADRIPEHVLRVTDRSNNEIADTLADVGYENTFEYCFETYA